MPAGLQAWDAQGRLVADVGDYSTRFVQQISITLPAGQEAVNITVGGVTDAGHFAAVVEGNSAIVQGLLMTELTAITRNGGVWLVALTGALTVARTVKIDIYQFS